MFNPDHKQALILCHKAEILLQSAHKKPKSLQRPLIREALGLYRTVLAMNLDLAAPYLGLAILSFAAGNPQAALAALNSAETLEPGNLSVMQLRYRIEKQSPGIQPSPTAPPGTIVALEKRRTTAPAEPEREPEPEIPLNPPSPPAPPPDQPTPPFQILGPEPKKGMIHTGSAVKALQISLQAMGFQQIEINANYDARTSTAVRQFQQRNKLPATGSVDQKTWEVLNTQADHQGHKARTMDRIMHMLENSPVIPEITDDNAQRVAQNLELLWSKLANSATADWVPQPAPILHPLYETLGSPGEAGVTQSRGGEVERLQQWLQQAGLPLKTTGLFDLETYLALKKYQIQQGLPATGQTDPATRQHLNQRLEQAFEQEQLCWQLEALLNEQAQRQAWKVPLKLSIWVKLLLTLARGEDYLAALKQTLPAQISAELGPANRGKVHQGPEVELLQVRLSVWGQPVEITGHYDTATTDAVRRFQTRHKLGMTGIVNAATAQLLCSEPT